MQVGFGHFAAWINLLTQAIASLTYPDTILVFLFHTSWRRLDVIQNSHILAKLSSFKQKAGKHI